MKFFSSRTLIIFIEFIAVFTPFYFIAPMGLNRLGFETEHLPNGSVAIKNNNFDVLLPKTGREFSDGLSIKDSIDDKEGMLFVYDKPDKYTFWMKGMKFPLDIIWIRDGVVVDISKNLPPLVEGGEVLVYYPRAPANMVLEINAGLTDRYGIKEGDEVVVNID